jgi:hypothetical protein
MITLVGALAYGYWLLRGQNNWLAQLPGMQKSLEAIDQRMSGAEDRLRSFSGKWDGLVARLSSIESTARTNLKIGRDFAVEQATATRQQLMNELDTRTHSIDARLDQMESSRQQDRSQMAALAQEVSNVRSEAVQRLDDAQRENVRQLEDVRDETDRNRMDLDTVSRGLDRTRVDFEVSKKQTQQLAPGLAFSVLATNVSRQQVDGYLHLIPEGNILWVHGQGVQQPMLFHLKNDKRPYEVVFTSVSADGAVGYLLMPVAGPELPSKANPSASTPARELSGG